MAKVYYRKIKSGLMTIDEVPERWRAAVFKMLKAAYDTLEEWSNREVTE